MKALIAYGGPFEGVQFVGPFDDENDAVRWGEVELDDVPSWWVVEPDVCNGTEHVVVVSGEEDGLAVRAICNDPQNAGRYVISSAYKKCHFWTQKVEKP